MANNVQKKDEEIKKLTYKKQQKEMQAEAAEIPVEECEKPLEQRKKKEDRINKLTSDLKNDPKLALQAKQYIEESGIPGDSIQKIKRGRNLGA